MPRIHYLKKGSGLPVILIHGFCETHEVWGPVTDLLADSFQTIAIDLPGFGKSDALPAPLTIDDVAGEVIRFIEQNLKLDSCVVLGHSLGGYVALAMVEKKPTLFSAMGLIHSTATADTDERKASRSKVIEFVTNHGVQRFIESFIPPLFFNSSNTYLPWMTALASTTSPEALISYTEAMRDRPDRTWLIKTFPKAILILAGSEDSVIPVKVLKDQSTLSKNVSFTIINGVAHMGMLEDVTGSADAIRGFIHEKGRKIYA